MQKKTNVIHLLSCGIMKKKKKKDVIHAKLSPVHQNIVGILIHSIIATILLSSNYDFTQTKSLNVFHKEIDKQVT